MAVTQSRIPWGYGWCSLRVMRDLSTGSEPTTVYAFEMDQNSYPEIVEIKYEAENIYNNTMKHVLGYKINFNLRLRENSSITSATGYTDNHALVGFYEEYYKSSKSDNLIKLCLRRDDDSTDGFSEINNVNSFDCIVDSITLSNVVNNSVRQGQEINLVCRTKDMITKDEYSLYYKILDSTWIVGSGIVIAGSDETDVYWT